MLAGADLLAAAYGVSACRASCCLTAAWKASSSGRPRRRQSREPIPSASGTCCGCATCQTSGWTNKNLLFESAHIKRLKLRQVVDVVFGVHDDKAIELGRRVKELEARRGRARVEYDMTQKFLDEQELGTRLQVERVRDGAEAAATAGERAVADLDNQIRAASTFAADLRARHRDAARRARQAAALLRDRETQLRRLIPLRAQYAEDIAKLTMLAEARILSDPLRVKVCPACLTALREAPYISDGHCTLCSLEAPEYPAGRAGSESAFNGNAPTSSGSPDGGMTDAKFDVSSELRATKGRLAEITKYVEELDAGLGQLRASCDEANAAEARLAREVDTATNDAVRIYPRVSPSPNRLLLVVVRGCLARDRRDGACYASGISRPKASGVTVSGSGPPRTPVFSSSRAVISGALSSKSNTSKLAAIRAEFTDFGIAERPSWRCQRSMTWAGVLPCLAAIWAMTGSSKVLRPFPP